MFAPRRNKHPVDVGVAGKVKGVARAGGNEHNGDITLVTVGVQCSTKLQVVLCKIRAYGRPTHLVPRC